MKNRNSLDSVDLLTAIRPFDAAPMANLSQASTIRSEARLEQILASNPATSPPMKGQITAKRLSTRQTWGLRLAAIPVAAALIVAASVAWPGGSDNQPANLPTAQAALASWRAQPTAIPLSTQPLADAMCREELDSWLQNRSGLTNNPTPPHISSAPVVSEARGDWATVAFYDEGVQSGLCLLWLGNPDQPVVVFATQHSFWDGIGSMGSPSRAIGVAVPRVENSTSLAYWSAEPVDLFQVELVTEATVVGEGPFTMILGRVSPEVSQISANFDNGEVTASIGNGQFIAWWPGTVTGLETAANPNPQRPEDLGLNLDSLTIKAILTDGTVVEHPAFDSLEAESIDPNRPTLGLNLSFGVPTAMVDGVERSGVPVASVIPGGPAEEAGVLDGDIIIAIDSEPVVNQETLRNHTADMHPGDLVTLTVFRADQVLDINMVLGAWGDLVLPWADDAYPGE